MNSLEVEIQIVGSREGNSLGTDVTLVFDIGFLVHLPYMSIAIALVLELLIALIASEEGDLLVDLKTIILEDPAGSMAYFLTLRV